MVGLVVGAQLAMEVRAPGVHHTIATQPQHMGIATGHLHVHTQTHTHIYTHKKY